MAIHIHTQGKFNRILVMATSVVCVMKMGNIVPRVELEPTPLAFWVSVLQLHHIGSMMSPPYHAYLSMQLLASEDSADYYNKIGR